MNISLFGLGYVGCVSTACLAHSGNNVLGVDVNASKVNSINNGLPTVMEKDLDLLIKEGWESGRITASTDHNTAVQGSDISIICVGTPSNKSGHLDLSRVYRAAENIGYGLTKNDKFHIVMIRSTVIPGTNKKVGSIIERCSGKGRGQSFEVVSNPEFLREGTAVQDFYSPPLTVVGTSSERAFEIVKSIYRDVEAPIKRTSVEVAEIIKLVNNSFHALKVTFANEIGNVCKCLRIDSHEVMQLFCEDQNLNISSCYLKPGFAYGGSCLPKDLSALKMIAHDNYISTPVMEAIEVSNNYHKQILINMVMETGIKKIGILGFSFKRGTDDLRNSPLVEVAESLLGKGCDIRIYDKNVHLSNVIGRNRQYIIERIPHLERIISDDLDEVIDHSDLLVVAHKEKEFVDLQTRYPEIRIIDLARTQNDIKKVQVNYEGICW